MLFWMREGKRPNMVASVVPSCLLYICDYYGPAKASREHTKKGGEGGPYHIHVTVITTPICEGAPFGIEEELTREGYYMLVVLAD